MQPLPFDVALEFNLATLSWKFKNREDLEASFPNAVSTKRGALLQHAVCEAKVLGGSA